MLAFAREWDNRAPLVIVPTKYYSTPTEVFRQHRISLVIWANHMVRANISAMQAMAKTIYENESLVDVEGRVATVSEIFRLQGAAELLDAEKRYARSSGRETSAVILAASRGRDLDELTTDRPKAMIPVAGKTVLRRLVDKFKAQGINDITAVGGYCAETLDDHGVRIVVNTEWESTDELASLVCALETITEDTIIVYGDLMFRRYILDDMLERDADILVVVDSAPIEHVLGNQNDLAYCSSPDDRALYQQQVNIDRINTERNWQGRNPDGRWVGLMRIGGSGRQHLLQALGQL